MVNHRAVVWIIAIILVLGVGAIGFVVLTQGEGAPEYVAALGTRGRDKGQLDMPAGTAVDSSGNLYVLDTGNNRIQRFSPEGKVLGIIGSAGSGPGQLNGALRLLFDPEGQLWVADTENHRLECYDPQGKFLDEVGSLGQDPGQFSKPCGLAFDSNGNMWVADTYNHRLQKFGPEGRNVLMTLPPDGENEASNDKLKFNTPWGVACDPLGNVYVADTENHRISRFTREGQWLASWGSQGTGPGEFNRPTDVMVDRDQNIFVVDSGNNRIQKFDQQGKLLLEWGTAGDQARQFHNPQQMAEGLDGTIYIADTGNNRIQRYRPRVLPLFDPGNNMAVPTRPKAKGGASAPLTPLPETPAPAATSAAAPEEKAKAKGKDHGRRTPHSAPPADPSKAKL